jgi:hypothetical protein
MRRFPVNQPPNEFYGLILVIGCCLASDPWIGQFLSSL